MTGRPARRRCRGCEDEGRRSSCIRLKDCFCPCSCTCSSSVPAASRLCSCVQPAAAVVAQGVLSTASTNHGPISQDHLPSFPPSTATTPQTKMDSKANKQSRSSW